VLTRKLESLRRKDSPFDQPVPPEDVRNTVWVEPLLVAEVAFDRWTRAGRMRAPVYRGLRDDKNPVARSNVCPEYHKPAEPSFHAFSFTRPAAGASGSFVIAGSGEAEEGHASYRERTVRFGDTSPKGMREKALFVLGRMEQRMAAVGKGWTDATAAQVYTVYDLYPFLADEIVQRGAAQHGLSWHFARPPVVGLDYEMDCRSVPVEHRLKV